MCVGGELMGEVDKEERNAQAIRQVELTLARMEGKLDNALELKENYKETDLKADKALTMAKNNEKEITEMQESQRWLTRLVSGTFITALITVAIKLFNM